MPALFVPLEDSPPRRHEEHAAVITMDVEKGALAAILSEVSERGDGVDETAIEDHWRVDAFCCRTVRQGHRDGAPCECGVHPRQRPAIAGQLFLDDTPPGLGNGPVTTPREFAEQSGLPTAGTSGEHDEGVGHDT